LFRGEKVESSFSSGAAVIFSRCRGAQNIHMREAYKTFSQVKPMGRRSVKEFWGGVAAVRGLLVKNFGICTNCTKKTFLFVKIAY